MDNPFLSPFGQSVTRASLEGGSISPFGFTAFTFDSARKQAGNTEGFTPSRAAERAYERQLTNVANKVAEICKNGSSPEIVSKTLREYAKIIEPWAKKSAANMVLGVNRKNARAWAAMAKRMGHDMRKSLDNTRIGFVVQERIAGNVSLIRDMALGAAARIEDMARESLVQGTRAESLTEEIMRVGEVSRSRARTIARTEISKANTALTMARAQDFGSTGYIWRTARDGGTRESHRAMEGVFVRWDSPPIIDGMKGHAGEFPNCRCYPEPVIPRGEDGSKGVYKPSLPTKAQELHRGEKELLSHWERQPTSATLPHTPDTPLLNAHRATIPMPKLTNYSLDLDSINQKAVDKAKAFKGYLGFEKRHAAELERQILEKLPACTAMRHGVSEHGETFRVIMPITGPNGKTVDVITGWIYRTGTESGKKISTLPHMTTCYIDTKHIKKKKNGYFE